jgi:hypothetical protein
MPIGSYRAWYQGSVDAPHISSGILRNTGQYEVITKARITCTPGVTLAAIQSELYKCQSLDRRPSPTDMKSCELGSSFADEYENPTYETLYIGTVQQVAHLLLKPARRDPMTRERPPLRHTGPAGTEPNESHRSYPEGSPD